MPTPTLSSVRVNSPLTNVSVAYTQQPNIFIADRVFPMVPSAKKTGVYLTYTKGDFMRDDAQERAPGTESAGGGFRVNYDSTYNCRVYGWHQDVDDQTRANQDAPLDLDRDATQLVTRKLLLKRETVWATNFFAASKWTGSTTAGDITPGTTWDDAASTPIEDVRAQKVSVIEKTGQLVNTLVVGPEVHGKLCDHPDIIDRIKHSAGPGNPAIANAETLAKIFEVEKYLVAWATKDTALEQAAASMDFVFGKHALLVYAAQNPSLLTPSGGYIITWTGYTGGRGAGIGIDRIRMDNLKADRIEGELAFDAKQIAADVGVFFSSAVA